MRCTNSTQGRETYGESIAFDALQRSGLRQFSNPELNNDQWQNNYRVRDGYEYNGGEYYSVPGLWIRENQAVPNWKNPNYTSMPSRCDSRWDFMMRVCACDP